MPQPAKAGWTFKRKVGWAATRVLPIPEPKVLSGEGSLSQLAEVLLQLGVSKPLLVTDALLVRLGCAKLCTDGLDAAGIRYTVFDQVQPNPSRQEVLDGTKLFKESGCDSLISLGGGSPMDSQLFGGTNYFSLFFGGCPTKNGLPQKGFPYFPGSLNH